MNVFKIAVKYNSKEKYVITNADSVKKLISEVFLLGLSFPVTLGNKANIKKMLPKDKM